MKVGKEEIVGVLAAIEAWQKIDLGQLNKEWSKRVERIAKIVGTVPDVTTDIFVPEDGNRYPTLTVKWDEIGWNYTVADCDKALEGGRTPVLKS